jgi:hypothetical protein
MSFTADITTDIGKVRYLIGDTDPTAPNFTDEVITGFLNMVDGNINLACAMLLESLATSAAVNLTNITLGSLRIDETSKAASIKDMAQRFRELDCVTPAFAVAEENLSQFNELDIIKNYIQRTEG